MITEKFDTKESTLAVDINEATQAVKDNRFKAHKAQNQLDYREMGDNSIIISSDQLKTFISINKETKIKFLVI